MAATLSMVPLACKAACLDRYAEPDKGWADREEARWPVPYRPLVSYVRRS